MKKIIKLFIALFVGFVFLTNTNAQILYDNLTVTIEGINTSSDSPLENAKVKYDVHTNVNLSNYGIKAVLASRQELLTDIISATDINNEDNYTYSDTETNNTISMPNYYSVAERSLNVYTALYSFDATNNVYKRTSAITTIERPEIPLTKRISMYVYDTIAFHMDGMNFISNPKKLNYKIGKITDNALLNNLKDGNGINDLLAYAKNDNQPIKSGVIIQDDLKFEIANNIPKSSVEEGKYYYVYASRDTENGKFIILEDVDIYQYHNIEDFSYPIFFGTGESRFNWNLENNDPIDTPTPNPASTISFESNSYVCEKNTNFNTYIISTSVITNYTSTNSGIATVAVNPQGNTCPSGSTNCYEVTISCLAIGTATLKATNMDEVSSQVSAEVLESIDPVKITFNVQEGTTCSNKDLYKGQKAGELCKPTKKGYTFVGWYTSETDGEKVTSDTVINEDITLYARWVKDVVKNPKTGFTTPIYVFIAIIAVSIVGIIVLNKKNKMF